MVDELCYEHFAAAEIVLCPRLINKTRWQTIWQGGLPFDLFVRIRARRDRLSHCDCSQSDAATRVAYMSFPSFNDFRLGINSRRSIYEAHAKQQTIIVVSLVPQTLRLKKSSHISLRHPLCLFCHNVGTEASQPNFEL